MENISDFEKTISIEGVSLIALKGVMNKKLAPADTFIVDLEEADKGDLETPLHELINPGNFRALVATCFGLPKDADIGEVRATKSGEVWIKSKESWVYLTHVPGAK